MFSLYGIEDKKGVRILINPFLRAKLIETIEILQGKKIKLKIIAKKLKVDRTTLWDYLNRSRVIPLDFFIKLNSYYKIDLSTYFKLAQSSNAVKIRVVKKLTPELAKILGTIIADGSLRIRKTKWLKKEVKHYEIIIREEYKSNLVAFCNWFNEVFGVKLKPKKGKNHYYIYISNKLLLLYFNKIFQIPLAKKTDIVKIPDFIMNSNIEMKKSLLQGLLMFDGGVNYKNGYISLVSKSKELVKQTSILLKEVDIGFDYISLNPDKFRRYRVIIRKSAKLKKSLCLFEKETEKWYRLREHLYGIKSKTLNRFHKAKNIRDFKNSLDKIYPKKRKSASNFSDVINILDNFGVMDMETLSKHLKKKKTVTYEYLSKLERWGLLESKRKGLKKVWQLNIKT